ncbi:MAG TPA: GNAT family N-acetyltransferase [Gemmatimonadales bacterium]|nr:GNAT family N-acetyltransferase [Gemmatimonadales bacterium]
MSLTIREMERGEDFAEWFTDLLQREEERVGEPRAMDEHYLVLTNEIGDWIGGVRYGLRGGVAQLLDIAVEPDARHQGHGWRLLQAFEARALELGAHVAEFWTDDLRAEPMLLASGWHRLFTRSNYVGGRTWYLMEKQFEAADR